MNNDTYTPRQLKKLMEIIDGTSSERMQKILSSGILSDVFKDNARLENRLAVRQALGLGALPSTPGSHVVDYSLDLEAMIVAGNYDWKNDYITAKRFLIVGKGKLEFEDTIFHFDRGISSEDAVNEILAADTKNPWEPAKFENILAYGAKNPEEQRKFPIVGLGSIGEVDGHRSVPCLCGRASERHLDLYWWDGGWGASRLLGVRKKVVQVPES